MYFVV
jgi:hypothetical protein